MAVFAAFPGPLGHFLFDHTGVDAVATGLGAFLAEFPEKGLTPLGEGLFGAGVALRQAALQDVKAPGEREPIGIELFAPGGFKHQGPDHEMSQRQGIHFLNHPGRGFAADVRRLGGPTRVLMGLLFIEHQFRFPSLMVAADELRRRTVGTAGSMAEAYG